MRSNNPEIFETLGREIKRFPEKAPQVFEELYDEALSHFLSHLAYVVDHDDLFCIPSDQEDIYDMHRMADEAISKSVKEVIPPEEVLVERYANVDPTLMTPHSRILDYKPGYTSRDVDFLSPEQLIQHNLKIWIERSLWDFWEHRWSGSRQVVCRVTIRSVQTKKVLPSVIINQMY